MNYNNLSVCDCILCFQIAIFLSPSYYVQSDYNFLFISVSNSALLSFKYPLLYLLFLKLNTIPVYLHYSLVWYAKLNRKLFSVLS